MRESFTKDLKHFSVETGKLHMPCPYQNETGIRIHVVIKDGICYRSEKCMVFWCKYNSLKYDVDSILSFIW